jgi:hypothetical protein
MGASLLSGLTWTGYLTMNKIKERNEAEWQWYCRKNDLMEEEEQAKIKK